MTEECNVKSLQSIESFLSCQYLIIASYLNTFYTFVSFSNLSP